MTGSAKRVVATCGWDQASQPQREPVRLRVARAQDGASAPKRKLAGLIRTIEQEVIPRLVLAQRGARATADEPGDGAASLAPEHVTELARLILLRDAAEAAVYVQALHRQGNTAEALYLGLLAPTARRLGEYWTADLCAFTDVTVGLCRLHELLHDLAPVFRGEAEYRMTGPRVLLAPCPGEQHTFGLAMVAEFFRRDGWDVWSTSGKTADELALTVARRPFSVVGLSMSGEAKLDALTSSIRAIKRASLNTALGVMVGGQLFAATPELAGLVGADATAADGVQAVAQARNLIALLASR